MSPWWILCSIPPVNVGFPLIDSCWHLKVHIIYQDTIPFQFKYKDPEIDPVPSGQDVATSICNVMERMPVPQKRNRSLLRPCEVSVRSRLHSLHNSLRHWKHKIQKITKTKQNKTQTFWMHKSVNLLWTQSATWKRGCLGDARRPIPPLWRTKFHNSFLFLSKICFVVLSL